MITVHEANKLILQKPLHLTTEAIALCAAYGRTIAEDIVADRDYPPFDRVAMDGYAISSEDWNRGVRRYAIEGIQTAGQSPLTRIKANSAIEIMTGAKLSYGTDIVVRYEDTQRDGEYVEILPNLELNPYTNVHRQGEDAAKGSRRMAMRMGAETAAIAASLGYSHLQVVRRPLVTMLSTGDELVPIEAVPKDFQIRESNVHAVRMALESRGYPFLGRVVADSKELIRDRLLESLNDSDLVLLSGAVSAGKTDFVPMILEELGFEKVFHRILQKPGKPLWFGRRNDGKCVFGLPGNPMSTLICLYRYVLPFLDASEDKTGYSKRQIFAELKTPLPKNRKLTHFVPVTLSCTSSAQMIANAKPHNGSGDFLSLEGSDGFLEIPGESEPHFSPEQTIFPFFGWNLC